MSLCFALSALAQETLDPDLERFKDPELQKLVLKVRALEKELVDARAAVSVYQHNKKQNTPGDEHTLGESKYLDKVVTFLDKKDEHTFLVRRTVREKVGQDLPAIFQFNHPGEGSDSWSVDAGIAFTKDIGTLAASLYSEYHYNDAAGKLKDTLLAGFGLERVINEQIIRASFSYKRDSLVSGDGIITDISLYPSNHKLMMGNQFGYSLTGGLLQWRFRPLLGLQYETGNGAEGFKDGDRISFRAGLGIMISLLPKYLGNRLTIDSNILTWNHLSTTSAMRDYDECQWYSVSTLTYWINTPAKGNVSGILTPDEQRVGVSLGYTYGDNPDEGDFGAQLLSVGLSLKF